MEPWPFSSTSSREISPLSDHGCTPKHFDTSWRAELASLSVKPLAPELIELVKEYCPLMASALARAGQVLPEIVPDLLGVNRFVIATLSRKGVASVSTYEGLKMLTLVNAGLSRFTSQAFSGTSPVSETECHFWTHSLLGTAVANIALWRFCGFVLRILGQEAIPRRVAALVGTSAPVSSITAIDPEDEFWYCDHLASVEIDAESPPLLLPPVTYFSGRDGFRSTLYSISAPLAVIGACNSLRWTLLTLTHEISHNVIRAVLGKLYPRPIDRDLDDACQLTKRSASSLFESIRQHLIVSVLAMQQMEERSSSVSVGRERMRHVLDKWHNEVEEIMVHVFDFLYFYDGSYD